MESFATDPVNIDQDASRKAFLAKMRDQAAIETTKIWNRPSRTTKDQDMAHDQVSDIELVENDPSAILVEACPDAARASSAIASTRNDSEHNTYSHGFRSQEDLESFGPFGHFSKSDLVQLANKSPLTLNNSKYAHRYANKPVHWKKFQLATGNMLDQERDKPLSRVQAEVLQRKAEFDHHATNSSELRDRHYHERILADFQARVEAERTSEDFTESFEDSAAEDGSTNPQVGQGADAAPDLSDITIATTPGEIAGVTSSEVDHVEEHPCSASAPAHEVIPNVGMASVINSTMMMSPLCHSVQSSTILDQTSFGRSEITSKQETPSPKSDIAKKALSEAGTVLAAKIDEVKLENQEVSASSVVKQPAADCMNREHAVFFETWGTPEERNKPKSRIRKVILSNLPFGANTTLVQSLIHGGSIDQMTLSPGGNIAYVTFTTGDACDQYYNKYPNGLTFKFKGRQQTVFVDKGNDVDVISGMLEGYLNAGASRVVRIVDADEDWTMRALYKVAEGQAGARKVESITDNIRNDTRTIVFRFNNIADAVTFRGSLLRSPEWEGVDIHFVADPCEKAGSIHLE